MKIAYLSTFYPYRGGIAQFNASLYRALEIQHQVKAYTFTRQYPDFLFPGKTQLVTEDDIADPIPAMRCLDSVQPFSWIKTAQLIKAEKPDLMIMKYWMSYMAPCLGFVAGKVKNSGTKVITVVDNAIPHERKFFDKSFASFFMERNTGFIAMSKSVQNDILSIYPKASILLKEHPLYDHFGEKIDQPEARLKLGLDPNKRTLLFFGFIRDYKGLDLLIQTFSSLSEDHQLVIAGEVYGSFDNYQKMIDTSPNKDRVFPFVRYISDHEVPLFFSASDAVVLPYKSATQSGISAIACHFEVPIIATDVGGLKEIISDEKTGIIANYPNEDSVLKAIHRFYSFSSAHWKNHMKAKKEELSWENFANALTAFSEQL